MISKKVRRMYRVLTIVMVFTFLLCGIVPYAGAEQTELININDATLKEIMKLPGIGKKRAEAIIQYRQDNDGFDDIDELKKIDGIGKKTFEKIKAHIVVR